MKTGDEQLIGRHLAGDPAALEAVIQRHGPAILGVLRGLVGPVEAEDLFQETFMRFLKNIGRYRHRGRLRAYLVTVARRLALDQLRKQKIRGEQSLDETNLVPSAGEGSPELNAAEAEQRQRVEGALESLSDKQREVLILHYFGGLTFREIARVTGVPLGTALGRMHYALRHLRKQCVEMEATP